MEQDKILIGRKDKIDLPDFGLMNIPAKIDTGAYGCALHCHEMEVIEQEGKEILRFKVLDPSFEHYTDQFQYAEKFSIKKVKSSVGIAQKRFAIKTKVVIFGQIYTVTFTLTDRKKMKYPVLIGRKFLSNKFVVDVALKDRSYKQKKDK
ncbi:RimK/LysX family protein [Marinoscillum sp. MHG1-6]|uniref:ATP-dependent zinc protease family protein n=1 Tax=Marinoscillum sp. MHG1-6 TaxID=2959627 RepID=UPI0021580DD1|nr:RimK/LysX family protein [Marinoscillum sp. MHG1-6]